MLLHVIPPAPEINVLPDTGAGFQSVRGVIYALKSLALNRFDLNRFF
jgi:hypothetical protein